MTKSNKVNKSGGKKSKDKEGKATAVGKSGGKPKSTDESEKKPKSKSGSKKTTAGAIAMQTKPKEKKEQIKATDKGTNNPKSKPGGSGKGTNDKAKPKEGGTALAKVTPKAGGWKGKSKVPPPPSPPKKEVKPYPHSDSDIESESVDSVTSQKVTEVVLVKHEPTKAPVYKKKAASPKKVNKPVNQKAKTVAKNAPKKTDKKAPPKKKVVKGEKTKAPPKEPSDEDEEDQSESEDESEQAASKKPADLEKADESENEEPNSGKETAASDVTDSNSEFNTEGEDQQQAKPTENNMTKGTKGKVPQKKDQPEEIANQNNGETEEYEYVEQEEDEGEKAKTEPMSGQQDQFTKPTINQKSKNRASPLCYDVKISPSEFEALYDEITELNSGVQTIRHSYGSIIKSLVHMQNRREKKKLAKQSGAMKSGGQEGGGTKTDQPANKPITMLTALSELNKQQAKEMQMEAACSDSQVDKYDMERFINPVTREETFKALFEECDQLNEQTKRLRTEFFDDKTNFVQEKYDRQTQYRLDRKQFNRFKLWCKKLVTVVDEISRNYNDDLLNMFRLDS